MSKGNLFLGFGRGSVGDVVFSRLNGQQVARARNRQPANPQTALQLLQRVVLKTASTGFSLLQDICNHAFQGYDGVTANQARFIKLNVAKLREQLAYEINSGDDELILTSAESNFASATSSLAQFMPYQVSEGSIDSIPVIWDGSQFIINADLGGSAPTYQQVLDALGLVEGDQLTFLGLSIDDTVDSGEFNGFDYSRVILSPDGGDLSASFLSGNSINDPNVRNEGDFTFSVITSSGAYYLAFRPTKYPTTTDTTATLAAATVIASRDAGGTWQRSTQSLVLRPYITTATGALANDHGTDYLGDAVQSYMSAQSSSLYLNQSNVVAGAVSSTPIIASATRNGTTIERGATVGLTWPVVVTCSGLESGVTYNAALVSGSTVLTSATVSNGTATLTEVAAEGTFSLVLRQGTTVIDTYATMTA